jgi:hypothetical protein
MKVFFPLLWFLVSLSVAFPVLAALPEDPQPLADLLAEAAVHNPALQAAHEQVAVSSAGIDQVSALPDPQFSLNLLNYPVDNLSTDASPMWGGNDPDYTIGRLAAARYGLSVGDIRDVIQTAIGGMNVTQSVEGLERYPVNIRYDRDFRNDLDSLKRILITMPQGARIPISQVTEVSIKKDPPGIRSENARRTAWV